MRLGGLAIVGVACAVAAAVAIASTGGSSPGVTPASPLLRSPPPALPPPPPGPASKPPVPRIGTLGVTRATSLVSYCWSVSGAGFSRGVCADGSPGAPAHVLRWRAGTPLMINLEAPGHDLTVSAERITRAAARPTRRLVVRSTELGRSGRRWRVELPPRAAGDNVLIVSARFGAGDVAAQIGIERR